MSNPAAPRLPEGTETEPGAGSAGTIPDEDGANPFGPDAPNVREDDPPGGQAIPPAPQPPPPAVPLEEADFAPDES